MMNLECIEKRKKCQILPSVDELYGDIYLKLEGIIRKYYDIA